MRQHNWSHYHKQRMSENNITGLVSDWDNIVPLLLLQVSRGQVGQRPDLVVQWFMCIVPQPRGECCRDSDLDCIDLRLALGIAILGEKYVLVLIHATGALYCSAVWWCDAGMRVNCRSSWLHVGLAAG